MINKVECVMMACDNCKQPFINYMEYSIFLDEPDILDQAGNEGWYTHGNDNKHYCPLCHTFNDKDEFIINENRFVP